MAQIRTAGASAQRPLSMPGRGRTNLLTQAQSATREGASAATAAKAALSNRTVRK